MDANEAARSGGKATRVLKERTGIVVGQSILKDLDVEGCRRILDQELERCKQTVLRCQHSVDVGDVLQFEQGERHDERLSLNVKCQAWVPAADCGLDVRFAREIRHHEGDLGRKPATGRDYRADGLPVVERGAPQGDRFWIIICRTRPELISQNRDGLESVAWEERVQTSIVLVHPVVDDRLIQVPIERSAEDFSDNLVGASGGINLGGRVAQLTLQRFCLVFQVFLCFP